MRKYLLLAGIVLGFTVGCGGETKTTTTTTTTTTAGTATLKDVQNLVDPYNKLAACIGAPIAGAIDGKATQEMVAAINSKCSPADFQAIEGYLTGALAACEAGGASSVKSVAKPTLSSSCQGFASAGSVNGTIGDASQDTSVTLEDLKVMAGVLGILADCAGAKSVSTLFTADIAQSDVDAVNAACTKADYNLGLAAIVNAVSICKAQGAAGLEGLQPPALSPSCNAFFRFGPPETTTDGPNASAAATTLRLGLKALDLAEANLSFYTVADFVTSPAGANLLTADAATRQRAFDLYTSVVRTKLDNHRAIYNLELTQLERDSNYKVQNTKEEINERLDYFVKGDLLTAADLLP